MYLIFIFTWLKMNSTQHKSKYEHFTNEKCFMWSTIKIKFGFVQRHQNIIRCFLNPFLHTKFILYHDLFLLFLYKCFFNWIYLCLVFHVLFVFSVYLCVLNWVKCFGSADIIFKLVWIHKSQVHLCSILETYSLAAITGHSWLQNKADNKFTVSL